MKNNFILQRIVILIVISVMLTALLTGVVFYFVSQQLLIQRAKESLEPHAKTLANYLGNMLITDSSPENLYYQYGELATLYSALLAGDLYAFYADGSEFTLMLVEQANLNIPPKQKNVFPGDRYKLKDSSKSSNAIANPENQRNAMEENLKKNFLNEVISGSGNFVPRVYGNYIVAGYPIYDPMSANIVGAAFITQAVSETTELRNTLYSVLIVSMAVISIVMMLFAFIASGQITKPVNSMRKVALAMASGNFEIRADQSKPGELGELAASLNFLSSRLSQTIDELRIERNRLRHILDGINEGIIAIDGGGRITHANPGIEAMFGPFNESIKRENYIGDEDFWADFDSVISESCTIVRSMHLGERILRITITPLEISDGLNDGAVSLFHDITESERLEQTRRDYVANVSHELRTPVSSIRSLAETLKDGMVTKDEDKIRYYEYMLHESMRLSRLIDDLLELSRLQSGNIALRKTNIDMEDLLYDILDRYTFMAKNKNISFVLDGVQDCPDAYTNGDRAEQVLVVLLDNAMKYTESGGGVSLNVSWDDDIIFLSVKDNGVGIVQADLPHIFDRFYKVDRSHSGNGTGLGLSIAKEILMLMDEDIWVESSYGSGSTFTFTLHRHEERY